MAKREYNSVDADYIKIKFTCNCGKQLETKLIPIRSYYDDNRDINSFSYERPIVCPKCRLNHTINFYDDNFTAYCEIPSLSVEDSITDTREIQLEYVGDNDSSLLDNITEMVKLKGFMSKVNEMDVNDKLTLYKMALIYAISIMDAFLGSTFRYCIKMYEPIRNNYIDFKYKNRKVSINKVMKELNCLSFQNLDYVVRPLYKETFGIEIPHNDIIQNAVNVRNRILHNSGREKDGYEHVIEEHDVQDLIKEVEQLTNFVRERVSEVTSIIIVNQKYELQYGVNNS